MPAKFRQIDFPQNFYSNFLPFLSPNVPEASGQNSRSAPPFSKGRVSAAAKRRRGRIRFDDCFYIHTNIARLRQLESGDRADKTGRFRNPKVRARKENRLARSVSDSSCSEITALA